MITDTIINGLPALRLTNDHAEAVVYLDGAHVASFVPSGKPDLLFMSPHTPYAAGKAMRGGVPVCWPWFGGHPTAKELPAHGFARIRRWSVAGRWEDAPAGRTRVELELAPTTESAAWFPHPFLLRLAVTVGAELQLALTTVNTGTTAFSYEDALHTYFAVADVTQASVSGLDRHRYLDNTRQWEAGLLLGDQRFDRQIDRRFLPATGATVITDPGLGRSINVAKSGSAGTVVWNPWSDRGPTLPDVLDSWQRFVCVEAGNFGEARVHLAPGTSHTTTQTISLG